MLLSSDSTPEQTPRPRKWDAEIVQARRHATWLEFEADISISAALRARVARALDRFGLGTSDIAVDEALDYLTHKELGSSARYFIQAGKAQFNQQQITHAVLSFMAGKEQQRHLTDCALDADDSDHDDETPDTVRTKAVSARTRVLLVLDEIQKVPGWSEVIKRLWDEEVAGEGKVRPLLLGSSALLVQRGLTESLAGRFFLHRCTHWSWPECRAAFGWTLDQWIYFGGYPGAAALVEDEAVWKRYVNDSLIETVLARDVVQMQPITKPTLLRHLFALAAHFPAQMFSYNKMLGQLTDAGNTVTLANYLRLLETAFLASGLELFSKGQARKRGSSPKLVVWNNALVSATVLKTFEQAFADGSWWGRLVENAVGAHLLNGLHGSAWGVTYWRDANEEVDFVVSQGPQEWAIEVKSGRGDKVSGMTAYRKRYPKAKIWLVGATGIKLEEFFSRPAAEWFQ